jgi:hypothetical protein
MIMKQSFTSFFSVTMFLVCSVYYSNAQNTAPYWSLAGNSTASNTLSKLGTTNAINLRLFTNNVERVHINYSNGYVGIGTTAPAYKLHVVNTANAIYGTTTGTTSIGVWGNSPYKGVYGSSTSGYGVFGQSTNGYGVYGNGGKYGVYGTSTNGYGVAGVSTNNYALYGNSTRSFGFYGHSVTSYGGFALSDSSDGLDAYSSNGFYGVYASCNNSLGYGVYGYSGNIGSYGSGGSYGGYGYSSSGQGVHGDSYDGLGGFFHSSSSWALEATTDSGYYAGVFFGHVYASQGYITSDRRLKKNIEDFTDAISIINKLQPKHYEFKTDAQYTALHLPTGAHYGLLAQDLEQVLPNLVHEEKFTVPVKNEAVVLKPKTADGKDENQYEKITAPEKAQSIDVKAVNYTELIPIIIKAVQELSQENNKLREEVTKLNQQMAKFNIVQSSISTGKGTLLQNMPNPASSSTNISYSVPEEANRTQLLITDATGKSIRQITLSSSGVLNLDVSALASGVYNYSLVVDNKIVETKKLTVIR